jgi:hypothetical protein
MIRLSLTYGAVGFSGAAGYLGLGQGQALAAGVTLLVALLLLGVRLGISGSLPRPSRPSRSTGRRATSFVVAFAVVSGMVLSGVGPGGGAVGTASAWEMGTEGECDALDYTVHLVSFQEVNGDSCDLRFGDESDLSSHTDHYQQGQSWNQSLGGYHQATSNFGNDTTALAWSKAKITIVNNLNDGNTSSVVKGEANETVRDYYSQQQLMLLNRYEEYYISANYTRSANSNYIEYYKTNTGDTLSFKGLAETEITLANGTTVWKHMPIVYDAGNVIHVPIRVSATTGNYRDNDASVANGIQADSHALRYTAPSTGYNPVGPLLGNDKYDAWDKWADQEAQVTANVNTYVDGVYSEYQQGEINATDIADPQTLAQQAATDYNSSGYYSYAATNLAALGYAGDMGSSFHVTTANNSYNGTLFYTADDVDQFETGTTYQLSSLNGSAYMAVQKDNGNGTIIRLKEDFTVESITDTSTGEAMTNTTIESYTYDSTNSSNLADEIARLSQLREEYEQAQTTGGTGGFDLGGNTGVIAGLLAVVALLALTRD